MHQEKYFLQEILAQPNDELPWLVFADWYAEQDDPRAELIRIQLKLRRVNTIGRDVLVRRMLKLLYEREVSPVVPMVSNSIGMKFAMIPGHLNNSGQGTPIQRSFLMSITPVNVAQYSKVMGSNERFSRVIDPETQIASVTWFEANEFCERLSELESVDRFRYLLPLNTQWNYAFKANTNYPFYLRELLTDTDPEVLKQIASRYQYSHEAAKTTLGILNPSPFGLFDMFNSIWQWCYDWSTKPTAGFDSGLKHVCCGWTHFDLLGLGLEVSKEIRYSDNPNYPNCGIRCIME